MRKHSGFLTASVLALTFVFVGCVDKPETMSERHDREQQELIDELATKGVDVSKVDFPEELYDLDPGVYDIKFTTKTGEERECTANIIRTTHGHKNLILNCK